MGKRKHRSETETHHKESVEEEVLNKYHNSKRHKQLADEDVKHEEVKRDDGDRVVDPSIAESDTISADKILKDVKKVKDEKTKEAIKLRKKAKKLEKQKARQEVHQIVVEANKSNKCVEALKYLSDWKHRPQEWKFKKKFQVWLLRNWKNSETIGDQDFDLFIEYIFATTCQSFAKTRLESEAKQLIDSQSEATEADTPAEEESEEATEEVTTSSAQKSNETAVDRARRVLQCV